MPARVRFFMVQVPLPQTVKGQLIPWGRSRTVSSRSIEKLRQETTKIRRQICFMIDNIMRILYRLNYIVISCWRSTLKTTNSYHITVFKNFKRASWEQMGPFLSQFLKSSLIFWLFKASHVKIIFFNSKQHPKSIHLKHLYHTTQSLNCRAQHPLSFPFESL